MSHAFKNAPDPARRTSGPVLDPANVAAGKTALLIIDIQPLCAPVSAVWGSEWGPAEHREFYAAAFSDMLSNVQALLQAARKVKTIEIVHTTIVRRPSAFPPPCRLAEQQLRKPVLVHALGVSDVLV